MDDSLPRHLTLRPGVRVVRRDDGRLQVGRWPEARVLLPDHPQVPAFLDALGSGRRPELRVPEPRRWVADLLERGLLSDAGQADRLRARHAARVSVPDAGVRHDEASRLLTETGLALSRRRDTPTVGLAISPTGEVPRDLLDPWSRDGLPHLQVTQVAGRVSIGPFVVPGLTACLRCVDAHGADRDPGHGYVVEQHAPLPDEPVDPMLWQIGLAWAVRDLVSFVEGDRPSTWSATVELDAGLTPRRTPWTRHPRCGCAWDEGILGTGA